jgi:hypothetical protein
MNGEITLAGVTLTLEEWEALDRESQELLLSLAVGPQSVGGENVTERAMQIAPMLDLLGASAATVNARH